MSSWQFDTIPLSLRLMVPMVGSDVGQGVESGDDGGEGESLTDKGWAGGAGGRDDRGAGSGQRFLMGMLLMLLR